MRRALVVGALLVLLIIVLVFLFNLGGSPGQAAPGRSPSAAAGPATGSPSTSQSASARASESATPSAKPSADPKASASSKPSASSKASASSKTSASSKSSAKSSADSKTDSSKTTKTSDSKKPDSKKSTESSKEPAATIAACKPGKLRTTLHGEKHNVAIGKDVDFALSVINGADKACSLDLNADDFELKIFSGSDRIWSTDDCSRLVREHKTTLKPEQDTAWKITWNGERSQQGKDCKSRSEKPQPGYYYATAQYKGAKPVQWLLILK